MSSMAKAGEEAAKRANVAIQRSAVMSNQHQTVVLLTSIRDTLRNIEQLLLGSTINGEPGETKGNSI